MTALHTATSYLETLRELLQHLDLEAVLRVGALLQQVREGGGTVYLAGNGGSAATSTHWANDLGKAARRSGANPIRVVSLGDHLSWVTALANDEGYARVFAGQLENLAKPGDLLVVISASGNSRNLVEAVRTARSMGASTVGFLGFDGGELKSIVDAYVWVPSPKGLYGPVEDMHHVVCHVLAACLAAGPIEKIEPSLTSFRPHMQMNRPRQAVILAGGRGSRLGHYTDVRPKPMVELHGRPFLEYLVEMLREQGFTDVLLLLGYLAHVVQDHFGDGRGFGVRIRYSVTAPEDLTTKRLLVARDQLDDLFLLMYCDNYWPMQFDRLWEQYVSFGAPALTTVYSNSDGYSRDSVKVGLDGFVEIFDRSRTTPGLKGVEISYAILRRDLLDRLPDPDLLIEEALYPQLAREKQLVAHVTDHRYYSIGSPERLPLTKAFLARCPAVILDRDGVLNRRPPRGQYVRDASEFEWLPGSLEALRAFHEAGYRVIVASNQAGVARGQLTAESLTAIDTRMGAEARAAGGAIDAIYYCPHDWDARCDCRKPKPGLLFQAQRDFSLDLTRTYFLGDDERDLQAAEAAAAPSLLVTPEQTLLVHARHLLTMQSRA